MKKVALFFAACLLLGRFPAAGKAAGLLLRGTAKAAGMILR